MLCDIARELGYLDLTGQFPLEATEKDLSLARFEAITDAWNRPGTISNREQYEFLVDKVSVGQLRLRVIYIQIFPVGPEPLLAIISSLFVECHVNRLIIVSAIVLESDLMLPERTEVLFGLFRGGGSKTFVVLDLPAFCVIGSCPLFIFWNREEGLRLLALGGLDDRGHELLDKAVLLEQTWPHMVHKVDQKSFDVGTVMVLIGHDHNPAVSQRLGVLIFLAHSQSDDLDQILDLWICHNLLGCGFPHIQKLSSEWEASKPITTNHFYACLG